MLCGVVGRRQVVQDPNDGGCAISMQECEENVGRLRDVQMCESVYLRIER